MSPVSGTPGAEPPTPPHQSMGDIEVIHTYEGIETMQTLIVGRDIAGIGAFA
jgi:hypothetical protein